MMITVERELGRVLTLLRNKIRERGFTQLEVQEALGWGRSYISQLLTKQKSLRIEQVLLILNVIGVDPSDFFGELYHFSTPGPGYEAQQTYGSFPATLQRVRHDVSRPATAEPLSEELKSSFQEMRSLLRGLLKLLSDKGLLQQAELDAAVESSERSFGFDDI